MPLTAHLDGLANYPQPQAATRCVMPSQTGCDALRHSAAGREDQVLPVKRQPRALFAFAQAVIDRTKKQPGVVCPNPFTRYTKARRCWPEPRRTSLTPCRRTITR